MSRSRSGWAGLALREYAPLAGWVATWAMIAAGAGLEAAVVLLAASQLTSAVRALVTVDTRAPLRRAFEGGGTLDSSGWRLVWAYEAGGILLSLAVLYGFAALLSQTSHAVLAGPLLVMALGLPALYAGPAIALLAARADIGIAYSIKAVAATAIVAAAVSLDFGLLGIAAALALRWWVGLLAVLGLLLANRRRPKVEAAAAEPEIYRPRWQEFAAQTSLVGQQRIAYRLVKILLSGLLGPVGSVLARTLRGTRTLQRIRMRQPTMIALLAALLAASGGAAAWLLQGSSNSARLILIGAFTRLGCIALSTLFWMLAAGRPALQAADLEDSDFD